MVIGVGNTRFARMYGMRFGVPRALGGISNRRSPNRDRGVRVLLISSSCAVPPVESPPCPLVMEVETTVMRTTEPRPASIIFLPSVSWTSSGRTEYRATRLSPPARTAARDYQSNLHQTYGSSRFDLRRHRYRDRDFSADKVGFNGVLEANPRFCALEMP